MVMMDRLSDVASGLLLGIVFGVAFTLLVPLVMPSEVADKPSCSPMFALGEDGVFGCIHGTGLSGKIQFEPCAGPTIEVPVTSVSTTNFTCKDEASL
jgi:hypothetical protein